MEVVNEDVVRRRLRQLESSTLSRTDLQTFLAWSNGLGVTYMDIVADRRMLAAFRAAFGMHDYISSFLQLIATSSSWSTDFLLHKFERALIQFIREIAFNPIKARLFADGDPGMNTIRGIATFEGLEIQIPEKYNAAFEEVGKKIRRILVLIERIGEFELTLGDGDLIEFHEDMDVLLQFPERIQELFKEAAEQNAFDSIYLLIILEGYVQTFAGLLKKYEPRMITAIGGTSHLTRVRALGIMTTLTDVFCSVLLQSVMINVINPDRSIWFRFFFDDQKLNPKGYVVRIMSFIISRTHEFKRNQFYREEIDTSQRIITRGIVLPMHLAKDVVTSVLNKLNITPLSEDVRGWLMIGMLDTVDINVLKGKIRATDFILFIGLLYLITRGIAYIKSLYYRGVDPRALRDQRFIQALFEKAIVRAQALDDGVVQAVDLEGDGFVTPPQSASSSNSDSEQNLSTFAQASSNSSESEDYTHIVGADDISLASTPLALIGDISPVSTKEKPFKKILEIETDKLGIAILRRVQQFPKQPDIISVSSASTSPISQEMAAETENVDPSSSSLSSAPSSSNRSSRQSSSSLSSAPSSSNRSSRQSSSSLSSAPSSSDRSSRQSSSSLSTAQSTSNRSYMTTTPSVPSRSTNSFVPDETSSESSPDTFRLRAASRRRAQIPAPIDTSPRISDPIPEIALDTPEDLDMDAMLGQFSRLLDALGRAEIGSDQSRFRTQHMGAFGDNFSIFELMANTRLSR